MFLLEADLTKKFYMPNFNCNYHSEGQKRRIDPINIELTADQDLVMERILENLNSTPIGQVLKKIASLPQVRQEKVLDLRQQLTEGRYNLGQRLDIALDRVLEELTT